MKFAGITLYDPYLSASEVVFHKEALYQVYLTFTFYLYECRGYTSDDTGE